MDETLSKFVDETGCDPSFARDLLEGKKWDFEEALKAFKELSLESFSNKDATSEAKTKLYNKPQRGISVVNPEIVFKARTKVIEIDSPTSSTQLESYKSTFVLPDLSAFPQDLANFLREDLIETSALVSLEQSGHLNWWADIGICHRLVPLATVGDGNCLLHAASLGMWGFHDRLLTLRKALFRTLADHPARVAIHRRWKLQQCQKNMEAGGLVYTDEEWQKEWDEVLKLASTNRRKQHTSDTKAFSCLTASTTKEGQPLGNKHAPSDGEVKVDASMANKASVEKKDDKEDNDSKECDEKSEGKVIKSGGKESEGQVKGNASKVNKMENIAKGTESREKGNESIVKESEKEKRKDVPQETEEGAYESLEDIHVFVLAHVLRRPIIIIADKYLRDFSGDPIAPIPFGGIYLPLEWPPQTCHKTPLLLVFESAHFSAGVFIEEKNKQSKLATAIPVVNHDLSLLPLHFSVDPGEKFDWNSLSDETQLPPKLTLNEDKQLQVLEKYLNISHLKVPNVPKKENHQAKKETSKNATSNMADKATSEGDKKGKKETTKNGNGKEVSWLENSMNKVGNFAGMLKKLVDTNTICVAKIPTNEKPEYYDQMISNYIASAKTRFDDKHKQEVQNAQASGRQQPCITPGCPLYGRADTSYLCSGCFKAQKSASESGLYKTAASTTATGNSDSALKSFLPPVSLSSYVPYDYFTSTGPRTVSQSPTPSVQPPSYSEACKGRVSAAKLPHCRKEGCEFYGSEERQGYCSTCFKKEKPIK